MFMVQHRRVQIRRVYGAPMIALDDMWGLTHRVYKEKDGFPSRFYWCKQVAHDDSEVYKPRRRRVKFLTCMYCAVNVQSRQTEW